MSDREVRTFVLRLCVQRIKNSNEWNNRNQPVDMRMAHVMDHTDGMSLLVEDHLVAETGHAVDHDREAIASVSTRAAGQYRYRHMCWTVSPNPALNPPVQLTVANAQLMTTDRIELVATVGMIVPATQVIGNIHRPAGVWECSV